MSETSESTAGAGPMGLPAGYDGKAEVKQLLRTVRAGALASLSPSGHPFSSLVSVASDPAGAPILLLSGLSGHTKHLLADPRASLLLARSGKGDPLAHPRITLVGQMDKAEPGPEREALKARFLARNPKAALYADFGDFAFWRMAVTSVHLNGGFAKAATYEWAEVAVSLDGAQGLIEVEAGALEHLNNDHADALTLYAQKLAGEPAARWRATGLDPEGLDLAAGDLSARISFDQPVRNPAQLRSVLADLANRARS